MREFESFWKWFVEHRAKLIEAEMDLDCHEDFWKAPFPAPSAAVQREQREAEEVRTSQQRLQELKQQVEEEKQQLLKLRQEEELRLQQQQEQQQEQQQQQDAERQQ